MLHMVFTSKCPKFMRERRQNRYTRAELAELLKSGGMIEAHCDRCVETWTISDLERAGVARRTLIPEAVDRSVSDDLFAV